MIFAAIRFFIVAAILYFGAHVAAVTWDPADPWPTGIVAAVTILLATVAYETLDANDARGA
jgi:hypothetical protein